MSDKIKQFMKSEMKKDADRIMEEVEKDSQTKDMEAPPELHDRLFEQIRQYEQNRTYENLPEEYKKLVDMGRVYEKKKKRNKYYVLAATLVMAMAVGVTSLGGPERLFKEVKWTMGGREQVNVDSDSEKVVKPKDSSEIEAYQAVKDEFGFDPVRMHYLPEQMKFMESILDKEMKMGQFHYYGNGNESIIYRMNVNYKQGSVGFDVEDQLIDEYPVELDETIIEVKKYQVKETAHQKWTVTFEYRGIQYFMIINNLNEAETKKILKNLFFF